MICLFFSVARCLGSYIKKNKFFCGVCVGFSALLRVCVFREGYSPGVTHKTGCM